MEWKLWSIAEGSPFAAFPEYIPSYMFGHAVNSSVFMQNDNKCTMNIIGVAFSVKVVYVRVLLYHNLNYAIIIN